MSTSKRPGMAKNEETVDHLEAETHEIAERAHYTHRLVGMHEPAPTSSTPPTPTPPTPPTPPTSPTPPDATLAQPAAAAESATAQSPTAQTTEAQAPDVLICPKCGTTNPAVSNRSDGRQCYRCDNCGYQWGKPTAAAAGDGDTVNTGDTELPPISAIDAPGG